MNIIELNGSIEKTEDCKKALNEALGVKKWKRLYKLKTDTNKYACGPELRCFTNEDGLMVTITENGEGNYCAFVGINIEQQIKAIKEIAKFYWTHDYGPIFYNPYTNSLWISGGDGGYCYSTSPIDFDNEEFWDNYDHDKTFIEFNKHPQTAFIQRVEWEAECNPDEEGYMRVGTIMLMD